MQRPGRPFIWDANGCTKGLRGDEEFDVITWLSQGDKMLMRL